MVGGVFGRVLKAQCVSVRRRPHKEGANARGPSLNQIGEGDGEDKMATGIADDDDKEWWW